MFNDRVVSVDIPSGWRGDHTFLVSDLYLLTVSGYPAYVNNAGYYIK